MTEETIFEVALGKQAPAERAAYLDQACAGDSALRQRIESLLKADADANRGNFMEVPAVEQLAAASPVPADAAAGRARPEDSVPSIRGPGDLTDWSAGQAILDDFVVERALGKGGMGKVYLLRSRSTGQPFAVKRALLRDAASRRRFLAELRTWIDLPEHPHLVACRFFRTMQNEVVIFAEFVERGSLETLIRDRQLTSLEQILDAAIQFAWGLHAAHEHGLVHQDVKPGNALVTGDGLVKVADFGLARARAKAEGQAVAAAGQSILVSCGGMTPPYCSPEQAQGRPLSRQTDVWSWGVSILEMFAGAVTWSWGKEAAKELTAYLQRPADPDLPAMPNGVVKVLQKCFRRYPARRWASLAEAAEVLQHAYRQAVGKDYPRAAPAALDSTRPVVVTHDRRTTTGVHWDDPREWLIKAFEADDRDPAGVEAFLPPRAGSRKAQAVADLAAYEEARRIFERLVAEGWKDLEPLFAELCIHKAFVHEYLDDVPGAVALYDQAIAIRDRLVEQEGRRELSEDLAWAIVNKAIAVSDLGDNRGAVALHDRAIAIFERLVEREGRAELAGALATACMNKAVAVTDLGETSAAVALCDRAIAIFEHLVKREGRAELAKDLAMACMNKAAVVNALGDKRAAVAMHDRAVAIYERLVEREGRAELANDLARAYLNKANAVSDLGEERAAVALYDQAIAIRERLVEREGRQELADELAMAYMNKANAVRALGDERAAVALHDRAIAIYERLVKRGGRRDLENYLALAYMCKANAVSARGNKRAAVTLHGRAIAIYERLMEREGRRELANDLATAYLNKANAVSNLGDERAAVALYDRAIALYERLVEHEGRWELQGDLAWVLVSRAMDLLYLGDRQKARSDASKAIPMLKAEIARTGRADLQRVLEEVTEALQEVL